MFGNQRITSFVTPEGTAYYACPEMTKSQTEMVLEWIASGDVEHIWYDEQLFFKNKEDRRVVKHLL